MDIVLNRRGGVAVKDQLIAQIEMKILGGELAAGQKLPSVRALARRLKLHANTISAAYGELETAGRLRLKRGSGVYVEERGIDRLEEAQGLDEMIRLALHKAFGAGYSGPQIRAAVERWLAANPPVNIIVVDPALDLAEILAAELRTFSNATVQAVEPDNIAKDGDLLSGSLVLCLPYHIEAVRRQVPSAAIEEINLEIPSEVQHQVSELEAGSIVLLVSAAPTVLRFASVLLRSMRGDELVIEVRDLAATRQWQRLVRAADLVMVDVTAAETVRRARPKHLLEIRLLKPATIERMREALVEVVPEALATDRPRRKAPQRK